jgi:hypothetical protein
MDWISGRGIPLTQSIPTSCVAHRKRIGASFLSGVEGGAGGIVGAVKLKFEIHPHIE